VLRHVLKGVGLLLIALAIAGLWWYATLPDGSEYAHTNPHQTAMMRYRAAKGGRPGAIIWVPLSRISPALRRAVIIAEDANFYHHRGIDWEATWSAVQRDWRQRRFSHGGSTITQQLAKNLYLEPKKTIWRKATEALIALRMERLLSKSRLLELYLNVVEWGKGVYGAEAAAQHYFGKPASALTIDEAAWLAAILPAPLRYEQHPRARLVVARTAMIQHYLVPSDEEEEPGAPPDTDQLPPQPSPPPPQSTGGVMPPLSPTEPAPAPIESAPAPQSAPSH